MAVTDSDFMTQDELNIRPFCTYANYLYNYVADIFQWEMGFAPTWAIERILTRYGHCGIFKNHGDTVIAWGGYTGEPTRYGFGEKYIGTDYRGKSYTGTVGDDVVVLWNNLSLMSDKIIIGTYAQKMVECDKSLLNLIRGARLNKLITASNDVDKITLDNVIKSIENGDLIVKIPPTYREIDVLDAGADQFKILDITDTENATKLQYLDRYRDNLLSQFFNEYGLDVNVINKSAQVNNSELHSMDSAVGAVISQRLYCREHDLNIVRSWGVDISVTVNPLYGGTTDGGTVENTVEPAENSENIDDSGVNENAENA